ncbi:hypothetical protein ACOKFD_14865 [Flagellimonas sp. S174]|uniref:hypothetical protein n=1 Tax=Flagellimonas sp. S174 TaxID=3410790 RepID=UPI003BF59015
MKKSDKETIETGALVGGILGMIINISEQNKGKQLNPNKNFDFQSLVIAGAIGAIIGIASFKLIKFFSTVFRTKKEILNNADEISYLGSVLKSYQPDEIDSLVLLKGKKIRNAINRKFDSDLLGRASYQGSVEQGTALSGLSDLDILVKFKKTSFHNEREMFDAIHDFFKYEFKDDDLLKVREQKVSIGLTFNIDGYRETIDIVPALRTDFIRGKNDYNLFKNPKLVDGSKKIKMNPYKQRDFGNYEEHKKDVIGLIKVLRAKEELPLKSFLIKELTKKAFDRGNIPRGLNDKLIMTLKYIRDNIKTIKLKSPDNPWVSLSDTITAQEKERIYKALDKVLVLIQEDKDYVLEYFPEKSL